MKIKKTDLNILLETYLHPSVGFFRALELKALYNFSKNKNLQFENPAIDLGCGDGKIAQLLFDERLDFGIDNGEAEDVELAGKSNIYREVRIEDARKMTLDSSSIKFVFSNCVIEHIGDLSKALLEIKRILKPGGRFLFTVPSHNFSRYLYLSQKFSNWNVDFLFEYYAKKRNKMLNHHNLYSHREWEDILFSAGLRMIDFQYYISKESLMLWDKMALEIFLKRKFTKGAEEMVMKKYQPKMERLYDASEVPGEDGGALIVYCKK